MKNIFGVLTIKDLVSEIRKYSTQKMKLPIMNDECYGRGGEMCEWSYVEIPILSLDKPNIKKMFLDIVLDSCSYARIFDFGIHTCPNIITGLSNQKKWSKKLVIAHGLMVKYKNSFRFFRIKLHPLLQFSEITEICISTHVDSWGDHRRMQSAILTVEKD